MNDYMQALHAWFCREPDRPELERALDDTYHALRKAGITPLGYGRTADEQAAEYCHPTPDHHNQHANPGQRPFHTTTGKCIRQHDRRL